MSGSSCHCLCILAPHLWELLSERGVFPLLSAALALFAGTESISSAVISTLTVMVAAGGSQKLACTTSKGVFDFLLYADEEARKTLLTKFPGVLELVSEAATNHIANEELQQHTLSFFTLALINSEWLLSCNKPGFCDSFSACSGGTVGPNSGLGCPHSSAHFCGSSHEECGCGCLGMQGLVSAEPTW